MCVCVHVHNAAAINVASSAFRHFITVDILAMGDLVSSVQVSAVTSMPGGRAFITTTTHFFLVQLLVRHCLADKTVPRE